MQAQDRKKALKGTVSVEEFQGRLRLRWRFEGKRYTLSIGLPDSKVNRKVAGQKATSIELDMASGNFDPTLKKYKPQTQSVDRLSAVTLFEKLMEHKAKVLLPRSLDKYRATLGYLISFFSTKAVSAIDVKESERFTEWLIGRDLSPLICRERLILIRAAWEWGIKQEYLETNPWIDMISRVRVPPKQRPKPFSIEEIEAIIQAFKTDQYYSHYTDYVEFLFRTGCRTAEAIGLRWKHLNDDCSSVWIGESLTREVRKATKTNRVRTITLTPKLQKILLARRPEKPDPDDLVFVSAKGGAIDDHNFRNRAWTAVLQRLGLEYRVRFVSAKVKGITTRNVSRARYNNLDNFISSVGDGSQ